MSRTNGHTFTIRDLAREFSLTPRALRFYEDKGLLNPARRGQARLYSASDRNRLALILRGKRVGFSLDEIAEMMGAYDARDGGLAQALLGKRKFEDRIVQLEKQRREIDAALTELKEGLAALEDRLQELERSEAAAAIRIVGYGVPNEAPAGQD